MSNVREFGARGDGRTDDTEAVLHALERGDGLLHFPPGDYLLTQTITVDLAKTGRFALEGSSGTAKLIMAGPGPAFHLIGTHDKTADPEDFAPQVWQRQRLPTVMNVEIEGRHPSASGFCVEGAMQATFEGVLLRELEHGIIARKRARNLLISHCHIYHNRGVGVFFDGVNLHQAIITGSHISYCLRGGIKIVGCEIRNLQITGNDIEYNFDTGATESADVLIDCSAEGATVREGTIVGNTIQAKYSPGGANVRFVGQGPGRNHKAGMFTISDNLIGSQEINVHLVACRGVVVTGNVIYSGHRRNLELSGSRNIVIGPNSFDHNPDYGERELCTGVRLAETTDCSLTGSVLHDCQAGRHTVVDAPALVREGLLEIVRCKRININGCQILDGRPYGVYVADSSLVSITGTSVLETRAERQTLAAVRWAGDGNGNLLACNTLGRGRDGFVTIDETAGVRNWDNLLHSERA